VSGLERLSAVELLAGFRSHAFSPLEAFEALAGRIQAFNPTLGAFTTLCLERARSEAQTATRRYLRGAPVGPLDGIPLAVKDLYDTDAVRTTYGSAMFAGNVPRRDAEAVRRACEAGAILVGKTQTHEFAWGISSINRQMGTAHNPWDTARISGGSSGGSAVALAAELVPLALGSDTGGSIRIPSAFCGTVGLKPTYGRVSTAGVFPLARSLDHAGPMARTPADAALLLAVIAGLDLADPSTAQAPPGPTGAQIEGSLAGLRVGLCSELSPRRLHPAIEDVFGRARQLVAELGAVLIEVELPEAAVAQDIYTVIQRAEALFTHVEAGLYPARAAEYSDDVRRWLELAREVELADYLAADAARQRLRAGFRRVFGSVDLLLTPVAACSPFAIGEEAIDHFGEPASLRELVLGFTVAQDLAGLPACTVRAGFDEHGCPVGVQLTGALWDEQRVLGGVQALAAASPAIQGCRPALGGETPAR
jgi:aspartyl-tRNA(Asn)/glutamyl-tRNA(Gln) amidotransferase subunit A